MIVSSEAPNLYDIPHINASDDRGRFRVLLDGNGDDNPIHFLTLLSDKQTTKSIFIKRIYLVTNWAANIVRGLHRHNSEWKFFYVIRGAAKFVTCKKDGGSLQTWNISETTNKVLVVPPGYANGNMLLTPDTILFVASSSTTEESIKDDFRTDPYKYGNVWRVKSR